MEAGELATRFIVKLLLWREFKVKVVTELRNSFKSPGVEYIHEPLLSRGEKPVLWFNSLRLIRTQSLKRHFARVTSYIPKFAFPVIPYAKRIGKKVVIHLHGCIPTILYNYHISIIRGAHAQNYTRRHNARVH